MNQILITKNQKLIMNNILESEVVSLWQSRVAQDRRLIDTNGRPVEVVYPGRLNDSRGGDFRDAVIVSGNSSYHGCIEIHTRASGWQAHGHHLDPAYNQVVLHVALEAGSGSAVNTVLQNGALVPTVILGREAGIRPGPPVKLPCREIAQRRAPADILQILEFAGQQRLDVKAGRFRIELLQISPGQVLYTGLAEALGYSKNQRPFQELSHQVSLKVIEELVDLSDPESATLLQALLLGKAGLLPSQRCLKIENNTCSQRLEQFWHELNLPPGLSSSNWELFKVRPGNYPLRRIMALSYLLSRFHPPRWPDIFLDIIRRTPQKRAHRALAASLQTPAEGYWIGHYDFGLSHSSLWGPVLLGGARAAEIAVNIILPFALGQGQLSNDRVLTRSARLAYIHYPHIEINSIERHMLSQLALSSNLVNSACRQQGLLHIYKTLCTQGKCGECPLAA